MEKTLRRVIKTGELEYEPDEQIGYLLRRAYQKHVSVFQENIGEAGLTSIQFSALCALKTRGDMSQTELVAATSIDQATIRGVLDRLKAREMISFGKDSVDGRKVIISLTAAGHAAVETTIPNALEISDVTYADLNPAERVALCFLLKRIFK